MPFTIILYFLEKGKRKFDKERIVFRKSLLFGEDRDKVFLAKSKSKILQGWVRFPTGGKVRDPREEGDERFMRQRMARLASQG